MRVKKKSRDEKNDVNLTKKKSEFIIKFLSLPHLKSTYRHSSPSSMQDVSHMKLV